MARITMREAISQALWEEMERDPAVFILGEEVGVWGGSYAVTKGFYDHFGGERVRDTPIAEAGIIGAAIGAALVGQRPVAELMTINFAFSAMDHIVNEAAKFHYMFAGQFKLPLVIRTVGGGGRQLGATHSQTPDAIFAHFPGLKWSRRGRRKMPKDCSSPLSARMIRFYLSSTPPCIKSAAKFPMEISPSRLVNQKFNVPAKMSRSSPIPKVLRFR